MPSQNPACTAQVSPTRGNVTYVCRDGGRSAGSGVRPVKGQSCALTGQATFCLGDRACWVFPADKELYPAPPGTPLAPGADWAVRSCTTGTGVMWQDEPIWLVPAPDTLLAQARRAVGTLPLPQVSAASAPQTLTLVNFETWFALGAPVVSPLRGSAALGVVAVATATAFVLDPGDGTPARSCPPTATLSQGAGCTHTYRRSSAGQTAITPDGKPGYRVRAWITWRVDYLLGNRPVTIPGAMTTVTGPITTRILPVAESQAVFVPRP